MPNQAIAAHARGTRNTDPLVVTEDEHDTIAWIITEAHGLAQDPDQIPDEQRRSMLAMHAAWVAPIFHIPRFQPDGRVFVDLPADEHRRALARLLRLLAAAARPNAHPTGMVFYIPARDADALADRIETGAVTS